MEINTLDGLPVELKICILQQMPDIQTIHALILASSKYYQTYNIARSQILYELLSRQFNDEVEITEALVAMRSEGVIAEDINNRDKIISLLDCRRRGTHESKRKIRHDSFSTEEIIKMIKLHKAAEYFMHDYASYILQPYWWQPDIQGEWQGPVKFSHTERARFFRAFYRLQIWCHIFGQPEHYPGDSSTEGSTLSVSENEWPDTTFSHEEAWRLLWGTMPPWEVEEIGCLLEYFMLKYVQVFQEITSALIHGYRPGNTPDSLSSNVSSADSTSPSQSSSSGAAPLRIPIQEMNELRGDPWSLAITFRYSMIEIGPHFLYKILHQGYHTRQKVVANNLRTVFTTRLWEVTGLHDDFKLPLISPADKYERDDISKLIGSWPILDQPNDAWLRQWGQGKKTALHSSMWLENDLGHFNAYPTVHRREWKWAYVFWDNERLHDWKVIPFLDSRFEGL